jgi:hypothetical protein
MYVSGGLGSLQDKGDHDYSSYLYLKLIKLRSPTPDGPLTEIKHVSGERRLARLNFTHKTDPNQ